MFIVWGRKIVYRHLGYVADFCPICRSMQPFALRRIGSAGHVYYISTGDGDLVGHDRTCQTCDTPLNGEPDTYASVSRKRLALPELQRITYPNWEETLKGRLTLEAEIAQGTADLNANDRHALIRLPFLLLSPKIERRFSSMQIDKEVGLALLTALILVPAGVMLATMLFPEQGDASALIFLAIGIGLIIWQGVGASRRYAQRQLVPLLAKNLKPLAPTDHELAKVLAELKHHGEIIGKKLKLDDFKAHAEAQIPAAVAQAASRES